MTVLEAAKAAGVHIPTLCYHPDLRPRGLCRVCLVDIKGQRTLQPACTFPVADMMVVDTNSPAVRKARRTVVELLLSDHDRDCTVCERGGNCELQAISEDMGIREIRFEGERVTVPIDTSSPSVVRNPQKCILCRRCLEVCSGIQGVEAIGLGGRGFDTCIAPPHGKELADTACVNCGQCIDRCPTGALIGKNYIDQVWKAIEDPDKFVVVQTAPAVRVALGETQGMEPGEIVTGQMVSALRRLGFDRVFDTDFTADLTIIEEGNELIKRIKEGGVLPMITSCSPGWIKFCEHFYPDLLNHLSSCKSPQQMFGALAKTYFAEKAGVDPAKIVSVSVMPCTAKKFECDRPEMYDSGFKDVDYVLTTRELGAMLKQAGIKLDELPEAMYDDPLGESTGAAVIFGATGGVMEAALRTAYEVITGETLPALDLEMCRGMEGVKEATVQVGDLPVKVAVAHGLANAAKILDKIRAGEAPWHFIEVMACPGGCLGGGGQPIPTDAEIRSARARAIYQADRDLPLRKSHENPSVTRIYEEFLIEPLGEKSHHLLHTKYTPRGRF
jgi:NADH-quinone oxidoreductase subunit G/NADP-reducing hydrogenase subunit HndD